MTLSLNIKGVIAPYDICTTCACDTLRGSLVIQMLGEIVNELADGLLDVFLVARHFCGDF